MNNFMYISNYMNWNNNLKCRIVVRVTVLTVSVTHRGRSDSFLLMWDILSYEQNGGGGGGALK